MEFNYKYILIFSCLILNTYAAKPFSSGSNLGSRNMGSSSFSNKPIISITDAKAALRFGQHQSSDNSKFGLQTPKKQTFSTLQKSPTALHTPFKQPAYNPYYKPTNNEISATNTGPKELSQRTFINTAVKVPISTNDAANQGLHNQLAYNPFYKPEPTAPHLANNYGVNQYPQQPAYNPFLKTVTNLGSTFSPTNTNAFNTSGKSFFQTSDPNSNKSISVLKVPLSTNDAANQGLHNQPAYNPFYKPEPTAPHLANNYGANQYHQQPAYNPFLKTVTNLGSTFSPTNSAFNTSGKSFFQTSDTNSNKSSSVLKSGSTNSTAKSVSVLQPNLSVSPVDFINSFPRSPALNHTADNFGKDRKGYNIPSRQKFYNSLRMHKGYQNQRKPNFSRNKIIVMITLAVFIVITIAVIFYIKLKK